MWFNGIAFIVHCTAISDLRTSAIQRESNVTFPWHQVTRTHLMLYVHFLRCFMGLDAASLGKVPCDGASYPLKTGTLPFFPYNHATVARNIFRTLFTLRVKIWRGRNQLTFDGYESIFKTPMRLIS
jgi:hypothetical protein